jgi:23S rRNA (cytosine1962-C5)-methyltransferase
MEKCFVVLKSGRDKSVLQHHPRLFSGAIKQIIGQPKAGDVVDVYDNHEQWLARGVINQTSQIAVRILTWNAEEVIDAVFWQSRVLEAVTRRKLDPLLAETNARRLIFGESDGVPGVIADDYAGQVIVEYSTLLALNWRSEIESALSGALTAEGVSAVIHARFDEERLKNEGVSHKRLVNTESDGSNRVIIRESDVLFEVDLNSGQKTGFYLDQRENRRRVGLYCKGVNVLNAFSFSGGFAVYAAKMGAKRILNVDSSAEALLMAVRNASLNAVEGVIAQHQANVFEDLRKRQNSDERFDVVILDPPKFAHNPSQIDNAARAYKDLNRLGMKVVSRGGVLATFSCSGVIDAALFQKIIFSSALEAQREIHIVERLSQASDHPVLATFPESEYLKGLICRVY